MLSMSLGLIAKILLTNMSITSHVVVEVGVGVWLVFELVVLNVLEEVSRTEDEELVLEVGPIVDDVVMIGFVDVVVGLKVTATGLIASGMCLLTQCPKEGILVYF